jgi:hypothetical protein
MFFQLLLEYLSDSLIRTREEMISQYEVLLVTHIWVMIDSRVYIEENRQID